MALTVLIQMVAMKTSASFWQDLGVGSGRIERIRKLSSSGPLADPDVLQPRFALLCAEIGKAPARAVVLRHPNLLAFDDFEERLPRDLASLRNLLPTIDLGQVLVRAPKLLSLDVEDTIRPRFVALETLLGRSAAVRIVTRAPTVLQLTDLEPRLREIETLLPSSNVGAVLHRAPSLMAYDPALLRTKLTQLEQLFPGEDVRAMIRREPLLLTYDVTESLGAKVEVYRRELPGLDVCKLLASTPRLLTQNSRRVLPAKLSALQALLPSADIPRLVRRLCPARRRGTLLPGWSHVGGCRSLISVWTLARQVRNAPQLLEYDVDGSLRPKLQALRGLFHPAAAMPPPPPPSAATRLATSKLLRARVERAGRSARGSRTGNRVGGRKAAALDGSMGAGLRASGRSGGPSVVGMLRLAALDVAVVEQRMGALGMLLPETDVVELVSKQPGLLRRDPERALRPRLAFIAEQLDDPAAATRAVSANPRLLLSGWGVTARLRFVREATPGGLSVTSPSTVIMMPKAAFERRYPEYRGWLVREIRAVEPAASVGSASAGETTSLANLEKRHGALIEAALLAESTDAGPPHPDRPGRASR